MRSARADAPSAIDLDAAVDLTRTGDVWVFRGSSKADTVIRALTNAPVNHVGMALVLEDLPPLMWHAELGNTLVDMWTGTRHRGVQLHDLREAVQLWGGRYGQRPWLRQITPPVDPRQEDLALETIARWDGTPFPSTARLAGRWFAGRLPRLRRRADAVDPEFATAYCAEVVASTLEHMGLLRQDTRRTNWYDPGKFWSGDGDELPLAPGVSLSPEVEVVVGSDDLARGVALARAARG